MTGTPGYMSPEQVCGVAADPRTDVWAVGCLLYECLSGRPLIPGDSVDEKLARTMSVDAEFDVHLPPRLSLLLRRCLAAQAAERFASMRDVRLLIEEEIAERALPRAAYDRPAAQKVRPVPGYLPQQLTSFVGRGHDLTETARLFDEHRMVTITGAGGCGKTRLSLELAGRLLGTFPDGAWWVELAALADPLLVAASAAAALGVHEAPGTGTLDALLRFLGEKRALIVLDNCEHVVDASAEFAVRVLKACPHVRILVTSRESLRVEGEAVYALAPLGVAGAAAGDAVSLFVDRARALVPSFQLDETNRDAVHEICRRLDGIPLAIELAAARVKTLEVEKIRDLLDDRFRLLTRGSRTTQPHQATLRALIDWSYDRLDPREQAVFRRLSVFRGAWTLDAAETVAAGGEVDELDVLDLFTRLVEKSLITRDLTVQGDGSARYHMLETVRAYAREKLHASSDEERMSMRRYRDYVVALSVEGEQGLRGPDQAIWSVRLGEALDDVREVLELVAHEPDGAEAGLALAGSHWLQWINRGQWEEGRDAILRALAHPGANRDSARYGMALVGAGTLVYRMGDLDRAREFYQEALSVLSRVGTDQQIGSAYRNLGNIAFGRGENDEAERRYEASLGHYRRANSTLGIAGCLNNLSVVALAREDVDRVETLQSEALQIYEASGIRDQICLCLFQLGIAALIRRDYDLSRARLDRAMAIARELDHNWNVMAALTNTAGLEIARGRTEEARALLAECLSRLKDMRDPFIALPILEQVADVAADTHPAESATVLAAATTLRAALKMPLLSYEGRAMRSLETRLTEALGEEDLARAREAGERWSMEAALSAAQTLLEAPP